MKGQWQCRQIGAPFVGLGAAEAAVMAEYGLNTRHRFLIADDMLD
jgi:hypothetical protein